MTRAAVITGWGAVSSLGNGALALWRGLELGRDGIAPIRRFSTAGFGVKIAGLVPSHNHQDLEKMPSSDLCEEYALAAAREACLHAQLGETIASARVALVMGTSPGSEPIRVFEMTERVADILEVRGPRITISTACTSSTNAIGVGVDLLEEGVADVVIAGGSDALTPMMFAGFHALGVLSPEKCAPFSEQYGTTLGEGAGFLVLETSRGARARGATPLAAISGYGLSGDAFHETGPDPTGSGVARAIRGALRHAGIDAGEIGYVNAHGTGTMANDPAEWRALQAVFGPRAREIPISATKSVLGHAQAAAGVLEMIATLLCMQHGVLPQTLRVGAVRANCPPDPVAQATPRPGGFRYAVCTNSAFGGANAATVIAAPDVESVTAVEARPVYVTGIGLASAQETVAGLDLDGLDPSSRYLTVAAALALENAGIRRVRGDLRDQTGLVCGVNVVSPASIRDLRRSIEERGLPLLSATAFSRMVLNAPAGTCSKFLSLRGPLSTLSIGPGSGLMAIIYAASLLARRSDIALMLAGGVDELEVRRRPNEEGSEGAACAMLSATAPAPAEVGVRLAGWGIAGPSCVDDAVALAIGGARWNGNALQTFGSTQHGDSANAATSARAFADATLWLRGRHDAGALVISKAGRSASCAAVLTVGGA